jgi:glutathione S-transferase
MILAGLFNFGKELLKTPGPAFLPGIIDGEVSLSNVDIALIPWAYRYYVLEHYRGSEYAIPNSSPELEAYRNWYDTVMSLPYVKVTLPDKARYLDHIRKYADGTARSKVANAVRRGVAAHELDDVKDEYYHNK